MTDTVLSNAHRFPQDEGFENLSDGTSENYDSAGSLAALGQAVDSDSYVRSATGLEFVNHDGSNDTVDVTGGIAYLSLEGETVNVQSGVGADNSTPPYDTTLPTLPAIMVAVPSTVAGLSLTDSTLNDVWLAYATDGTVTDVDAGDVYLRHGDGVSEPPHPSVKLGEANPDDSTANVLANRGASPSFDQLEAESASVTGEVDSGAVSTDKAVSKSLPTWRVYKDGSDVVGVDESGEIARDTDAATVWQAVFDQANNQFDDNEKLEPVAEIDSGFGLFSLSSEIIMRPGPLLRNVRFDASGLSSPSTTLEIGPDDGVLKGGVGAHNVIIREAADTAFRIKDVAHERFSNLTATSPTGDGFHLSSLIGCTLDKLQSRAGGAVGIRTNKTGDSTARFNSNTFIEPRASGSVDNGFHIQTAQHCEFISPVAENGESIGILEADVDTDDVSHNKYQNPWIEGNGGNGIRAQGTGSVFCTPRLTRNGGGGGGNQGLRINKSDGVVVRGPIGGNDLVYVSGDARGTRLYDVSDEDMLGDTGTRTLREGVGENAGDPSAGNGQWAGNGREGIEVVDTTNGVRYTYRGGSWV